MALDIGDILGGLGLSPFEGLSELGRMLQANKNQNILDADREAALERVEEREVPLFNALDVLARKTGQVATSGLLAGRDFFGSADERFGDVAIPLLERISERTELGISGAEDIAGGFADLEAEGRGLGRDLRATQRRRERRLLGMLQGLGAEERAEASRSFGALGRTQQARLAGMGLGGTTAAAGVASGVARLRRRELSLLNERLRGERLDLSERLSGETLNIQDITGQRDLGLARDTLGAQAEALGIGIDLRGQDIQATGELGFAELDFGERTFANLFGLEQDLGVAPAQALVEAEEAKTKFSRDIVFEPPILVGQ